MSSSAIAVLRAAACANCCTQANATEVLGVVRTSFTLTKCLTGTGSFNTIPSGADSHSYANATNGAIRGSANANARSSA